MSIIASAFATQKTQNQCLKKQNYTLFSNVGQLFEFSKKPFVLVHFFLNFKIREPSVSIFLVFQNQKTASFSSLKKIRIKEPTILAI
jgi:hypothetical protein